MLTKKLISVIRKPARRAQSDSREIYRLFYDCGRYPFDFADDFTSEGWMQCDTDDDASYFGVWVNPKQLFVLTYAEGDWALICYADREQYNAAVKAIGERHGHGCAFMAIDRNTITTYTQDRSGLLA